MKLSYLSSQKYIIPKLFSLYLLNCLDMLFTYTLLKTGYFYEVNPIMRVIIHTPYLSLLIKIIIPGVCFLLLFDYVRKTSFSFSLLCTHLTHFVLLIYIGINCLHVYYLLQIIN